MHGLAAADLPWSTIAQLQRVQNAATLLILGLSAQDHVHDAVLQLHWLPITTEFSLRWHSNAHGFHKQGSSLPCGQCVTSSQTSIGPKDKNKVWRQLRDFSKYCENK